MRWVRLYHPGRHIGKSVGLRADQISRQGYNQPGHANPTYLCHKPIGWVRTPHTRAGMTSGGVERAKLQCHVPTITLITIANKSKDLARPIQTSTGQQWASTKEALIKLLISRALKRHSFFASPENGHCRLSGVFISKSDFNAFQMRAKIYRLFCQACFRQMFALLALFFVSPLPRGERVRVRGLWLAQMCTRGC